MVDRIPKALVINPWVADFKLYDEWMHPVGLYFLISLLRYNKWDITYINCLASDTTKKNKRYNANNFPNIQITKPAVYGKIPRRYKRYGISEDSLRRQLARAPAPDIIFIGSGMTYWIDGLIATVTILSDYFPDTRIIIGGISSSLIADILKKRIQNGYIFSGTLFGSLDKLKKMHPYLYNLTAGGWRPTLKDALELLDTHAHGPVLTSLGCPYNCSYCASSYLQPKFVIRPLATVIGEMEYLIEHFGIQDFALYDDALLYQADKNFLPLARAIKDLKASVRLHAPNGLHVRYFQPPILEAMRETGFVTIRLGYESGSKKHQRDTDKKTSRAQLSSKIDLIKSAGFSIHDIGVYIMAGLPEQNVNDVLDDVAFVASCGVTIKPVFLSPVPQTPIFDFYARQFPQLKNDPLTHNDIFFITLLPQWDIATVEEVIKRSRQYNNLL
ncbi:MAG: B12-binding domain-containing radical SAM protein [bacterium]